MVKYSKYYVDGWGYHGAIYDHGNPELYLRAALNNQLHKDLLLTLFELLLAQLVNTLFKCQGSLYGLHISSCCIGNLHRITVRAKDFILDKSNNSGACNGKIVFR